MTTTFRSLGEFNYRVWFAGALISNVGVWMQRTAQDWIVLVDLTDYDAAAVGIVMALNLGPQLLLMPWAGLLADRIKVRKLLIITQATMGFLGLILALVVITGIAELWHIYVLAGLLGFTSAVDAPVRQTFVAELVASKDLSNAVSLNSVSFHVARMIGPAIAGVLIVIIGAGWVFLINAFTFTATLTALFNIRMHELREQPRASRSKGQIMEGFRYVRSLPQIVVLLIMVFLIGTFGFNFPIFTSTMATIAFNRGAAEFGMLTSMMAIGSVIGALIAARRDRPRFRVLITSTGAFGVSCVVSALMPTFESFAISLVLVGFCGLSFIITANAMVQTTVAPMMRGRVMALYLAIYWGGTPLGAPIAGWIVNQFGPRWGLGLGAAAGFTAALVALTWMVWFKRLRVHLRFTRFISPRLQLSYAGDGREIARDVIATDEATAQKT